MILKKRVKRKGTQLALFYLHSYSLSSHSHTHTLVYILFSLISSSMVLLHCLLRKLTVLLAKLTEEERKYIDELLFICTIMKEKRKIECVTEK